MDKVYIIIVNWNGWQDTIECLESVFRNRYPHYQVVLCDNGSQDGSIDHIADWATGHKQMNGKINYMLRHLSSPPIPKPVRYVKYTREQAEAGGDSALHESPLVLVQTGENLGFAGGNNVGLRYALSRSDFRFVWLLNNDTVIERNSLVKMVEHMLTRPEAGICGSTVLYYHRPDIIWTLGGGTFNKWLAKSRCLKNNQLNDRSIDTEKIEANMAYIAGASMLVSANFLKNIGLLSEDYFLYYEEPDWAFRAKGRYALTYAHDSIVYHKVAESTKLFDSVSEQKSRNFFWKNQIKFTRKHFPIALPVVFMRSLLWRAIYRWFSL